ncbi:Alpha/Beta hydrolase protein [Exophiala viscosa]|uniref:Alpha/Beta hydrolase protein n=1 Tax=Exophiala viscosa TaxID=2486360 RepID=A0AAN6E2F4_9EURO|nr:Alpha/Beta hydrolase protein [Exophiala viscosa]KAI1630379.1 Alpha/Beta hydrolase protein [Exophiala viscosa]
MRSFFTAAALSSAIGLASAWTCQNITVPVSISARNAVFNISIPQTNIDVTNFIVDLAEQGVNYTQEILAGYTTVSGDFDLAATYCAPASGAGKTLQILTHGIGFDRSYWDLSFNNYNYSYVETAIDQYGYSTLSWDRLGIGMSSHGNPLSEIQVALEHAALTALTELAWNGSVPGVSAKFEKIVHVGHSFGSALSYALARDTPSLSDGLVLTGFSQNGTFLPFFELGGNWVSVTTVPALSSYVAGYFGAGTPSGVQTNFFSPGEFDPAILALAYSTGQPVSVGELLTIGGSTGGINYFTGPVFVITGARDLPYCGGNCLATGNPAISSIPAAVKEYFPDSSNFQSFIVPDSGHGLNLEYTHEITYQQISQFLVGNGF